MAYRVNRKGNRQLFVETDSLKSAQQMAKQQSREGYDMEIREKRGSRWYLIGNVGAKQKR